MVVAVTTESMGVTPPVQSTVKGSKQLNKNSKARSHLVFGVTNILVKTCLKCQDFPPTMNVWKLQNYIYLLHWSHD